MKIANEFNWLNKNTNKWEKVKVNLGLDESNVYLKSAHLRIPRVSSHTLVSLIGRDTFNSIGSTILKILGQLEKDTIPIYQTIKGGVVEHFTTQYLKLLFKEHKDIDIKIESYNTYDFASFNQFEDKSPFSGVLDKYIVDYDIPVEIKSKETIKRNGDKVFDTYDYIVNKGNFPENEIVQGKFLAHLKNSNSVLMVWGFVNEVSIEKIKSIVNENSNTIDSKYYKVVKNKSEIDFERIINDLNITFADIQFHSELYEVDHNEIIKWGNESLDLIRKIWKERKISSKLFSDEELRDVNDFVINFKE